jgi:hypothetical protein
LRSERIVRTVSTELVKLSFAPVTWASAEPLRLIEP